MAEVAVPSPARPSIFTVYLLDQVIVEITT